MELTENSRALEVIQRLEEAGYEGWIVGGAVRDAIMHLPIHDVDLATDATPSEIEEVFSDVPTIDVGKRYGTIRVQWKGTLFEITTYRADGTYSDGRHPDEVQFSKEIQKDLERRDFTINAMAWHPRKGLLDLFGGKEDIRKKRLRAVGAAKERLEEDALRMLRAIRFSARFHFSLDRELRKAIRSLSSQLEKVSEERIYAELEAMLEREEAGKAWILLASTKVLPYCLPAFQSQIEVSAHFDTAIQMLEQFARLQNQEKIASCFENNRSLLLATKWAALYRSLPKENSCALLSDLHFLKASRERITQARQMTEAQMPVALSRYLVRKQMGAYGDLFAGCLFLWKVEAAWEKGGKYALSEKQKRLAEWEAMAKEILDKGEPLALSDLEINGRDLLSLGYPQGREIGLILNQLLEEVWQERVNNKRSELLQRVKRGGEHET